MKRAVQITATILLVMTVLLAIVGSLYEPNTEIPAGLGGEHVVVRGVPLRVLRSGAGRDLFFIHGSPGSVEDWEPVTRALSGSFRATAFDRPGHGSSGDTGRYDFEHNAEMALELIRALGLRNVIVVGHSYGGTTALAMALRAPPEVDAYVVVDSATYTPSREPNLALRAIALPLVGRGFAAVVGPRLAPRMIRAGLDLQFAGRRAPDDFAALRVGIWSAPKVTHAIAVETIDSAANLAALHPRYPSIRKPVHVVAQADDPFRRSTAERLHRDVPGSTLELVPGTGHYVQFERPDAVIRAIRRAAGP